MLELANEESALLVENLGSQSWEAGHVCFSSVFIDLEGWVAKMLEVRNEERALPTENLGCEAWEACQS